MFRLRGLLVLVVWITAGRVEGESPQALGGQGAEGKGTVDRSAPDAAKIARLIGQLGSGAFAEREAASRALEAIGLPARDALRKAVAESKDPEVLHRARRLVELIENRLDGLAVVYREYGLPLPPPKARLVRYVTGGGGTTVIIRGWSITTQVQPLEYTLAFEAEPATKSEGPCLLRGTTRWRPGADTELQEVTPDPAALANVPFYGGEVDLAIQCHARGWDALARAVLERASGRGADMSPRALLPSIAWEYWTNELVGSDTDLATIARYFRTLIAAERELATKENRELLVSLEASLVPSGAKPGSVAAMIDDLIQVKNNLTLADPVDDPRCLRVLEMGFTAVPELIKHLEDDRLTRFLLVPGGKMFRPPPPRHYRVRDLAEILLDRLAAGRLLADKPGGKVGKAAAQAWWAEAKRAGEEAYLVAQVLPAGKGEPRNYWHVLPVLAKKYPRRLAEIYWRIVDTRPQFESWPVAEAVGRGPLPPEEKVKLFLHALKGADNHRLTAIVLVMETAGPRILEALRNATRGTPVGVRLEILWMVSDAGGKWGRKERLEFLRAFLNDAEAGDLPSDSRKLDRKVPVGSEFTHLEVRNYAAMQIASLLKISVEPKPEWTAKQWAALREQVRRALRR
jgi:hypothetical protein